MEVKRHLLSPWLQSGWACRKIWTLNCGRACSTVMAENRNHLAGIVSLLYALAAGLWILLSDRVVAVIFPDADSITHFQTYKGLAFVGFTALLLFLALRRRLKVLETETSERQQAQSREQRNQEEYRRAIAAAGAIPYRKVFGSSG